VASLNSDRLHRQNLPLTPTTSRIVEDPEFQLDKQVAFSHAYEGAMSEMQLPRLQSENHAT
jgi:hypothetical protein